MAGGKSPYGMNRSPIPRSLEQQNARSFGIVWIVLNDFRGFYTFHKFSRKQSVSGQLVVSVLRDQDIAFGDQSLDAVEGIAHLPESQSNVYPVAPSVQAPLEPRRRGAVTDPTQA